MTFDYNEAVNVSLRVLEDPYAFSKSPWSDTQEVMLTLFIALTYGDGIASGQCTHGQVAKAMTEYTGLNPIQILMVLDKHTDDLLHNDTIRNAAADAYREAVSISL